MARVAFKLVKMIKVSYTIFAGGMVKVTVACISTPRYANT